MTRSSFSFLFFRFNLTDIFENFTRRIYHNVTKETKLSLLFFFFEKTKIQGK